MDWASESDDIPRYLAAQPSKNADSVIQVLQQRASVGRPFAWIGGETLLSVGLNPSSVNVSAPLMEQYSAPPASVSPSSLPLTEVESQVPPHVLQVATTAFYQMLYQRQDQTVLLTGESGSGKSVARKAISQQLIRLARNGKKKSKVLSGATKMECALEAFGHSKTPLSDSASGFGRLVEYQYTLAGRMAGLKLLDYGLDLRRVTAGSILPQGERNYNVFYQLIAGLTPDERDILHLPDASSFAYLNSAMKLAHGSHAAPSGNAGSATTLSRISTLSRRASRKSLTPSVATTTGPNPVATDPLLTQEDANAFTELREHLKSLGIGRRTQAQMFKILAGILHLGNVIFGDNPDEPNDPCHIKNMDTLEMAADLFDLPANSLSQALTYKSRWVSRELCSVVLKSEEAVRHRDDLAQTLYSLLFSWLVEHINTRLCKEEDEVDSVIAIADFPWFRSEMVVGAPASFSTLVSNYAQERLVHYTHSLHFEDAGAVLRSESVDITVPHFQDNLWCMDLFRGTSRQEGLLNLIDNAAQGARSSSFAQDLVKKMDQSLKQNPHYIPSHKCSTGNASSTTLISRPRSIFGIRHHHQGPSVEYDLEDFVDNTTAISDFFALFRGSASVLDTETPQVDENNFIASLFSKKAGLMAQKSAKGNVVGASKVHTPLRKPSMKRKKNKGGDNAAKPVDPATIDVSTFGAAVSAMDDVISTIKATQPWIVICLRGSQASATELDPRYLKRQMTLLSIQELIQYRTKLDVDTRSGYSTDAFVETFGVLMRAHGVNGSVVHPDNWIRDYAKAQRWSEREFVFGRSRVFISGFRLRSLWAGLQAYAGNPASNLASPVDGEATQIGYAGALPAYAAGGEDDDNHSEVESNIGSEFNVAPRGSSRVASAMLNKSDLEAGHMRSSGKKESRNEHIDSVTEVSSARRCWVCCTWTLTWWIPSCCLTNCGGMKRPDIRMAWREKVALCVIIAFMCMALLFFIIGLRFVICPPSNIRSMSEVQGLAKGQTVPWVSAQGRYYYIKDLMDKHLKDYAGTDIVRATTLSGFYGTDVSKLFWKQDLWPAYCPGLAQPPEQWDYLDSNIDWMTRNRVLPAAMHRARGVSGRPQPYLAFLSKYARGRVGWTIESVKAISSDTKNFVIIYNNVYYVSPVFAAPGSFSPDIQAMLSRNPGEDITKIWRANRNLNPQLRAQMDATLNCMNNMLYVGTVDNRDTFSCRLTNGILFGSSIILVAVIGVKFLAALQFGSRKSPEEPDKFVICMVPCYTEGAESLSRCLESLATTSYDDKRKLIFVICDGMIIGSGNDRPTPRIVLDILGVPSDAEPDALPFQSLGEGNRQYNMGRVYSGLYEVKGHSVPYVVVVKTGSPSERVKPGNRGKRDSQMILMRFLSRVHFNADFSPLELELYRHLKNIIGISPSFYELVLMVDADTKVESNSLNALVSTMVHDVSIMGLCGETLLANEKTSWVTAIQVYEYFISHHMAKAFESLFGTVTCLPGCFCMYRIRTATKNIPLLVAPSVLTDYGVNTVDTLHQKNLLHLGEDRYLTTLMLKHFPAMRTKFTPEAKCETVAPERWSVLLSQRRRWINSTVHNLFELAFLEQLCGFCCFSMRFVVFLDLFATFVQPATVFYIAYLMFATLFFEEVFPMISIILLAAIYGFQVIIFLIKREWAHIIWMIIYILAIPIFSLWIPCYSFWRFDDFSWGNTRVVVGEGKKTVYVAEVEPFNPNAIPMKRWRDVEEEEDGWDKSSMASGYTYKSGAAGRPGYAASEYSAAPSAYNRYPPGPGSVVSGYSQSYAGSEYGGGRRSAPNRGAAPFMPTGQPAVPPPPFGSQFGSMERPMSMISFGGGLEGGVVNAYLAQQQQQQSMPTAVMLPPSAAVGAAYPTDDQLLIEIKRILATADLMSITKKQIRDELSKRFNVDLKSRKDSINRMVDGVLQERL